MEEEEEQAVALSLEPADLNELSNAERRASFDASNGASKDVSGRVLRRKVHRRTLSLGVTAEQESAAALDSASTSGNGNGNGTGNGNGNGSGTNAVGGLGLGLGLAALTAVANLSDAAVGGAVHAKPAGRGGAATHCSKRPSTQSPTLV